MEVFSLIIGTIMILLVLIAIITLIKYPKQILIDAPATALKIQVERFLIFFPLITLPVWLPLWFLDNHYKWGIFKHKIFKIFSKRSNDGDSFDLPDVEYEVSEELEIDFAPYDKYFISSNPGINAVKKILIEHLGYMGKSFEKIEGINYSKLTILKVEGIELYDFFLLIQCLQGAFETDRNFGFARKETFAFFGMADKKTLQNVVGKTSQNHKYAFNLVRGQETFLGINNDISFKSSYSTKFFERLITESEFRQ